MIDSTISSPAWNWAPNELATKFTPSVRLRVKMISSSCRAFRNRRAMARASSYLAVAALERKCRPRCTLAYSNL